MSGSKVFSFDLILASSSLAERNVVAIKYQPILKTPILSPANCRTLTFLTSFGHTPQDVGREGG